MRNLSIRFRLTVCYAFALATTFVIFAGALWLALEHSIRTTVDRNLHSRLEAVRHYLDQQGRKESSRENQELSEDAELLSSGALLRLESTTGEVLYDSRGQAGWRTQSSIETALPPDGRVSTILVHGQPIRTLSAPVAIGIVRIGLPLTSFQDIEKNLAWTAWFGSPLLLVIASTAGYWMSGRALRPVDEVATKAHSISAQNLAERLPSRGTGDELDRLSDTLNGMLARLDSAFAQVTRFTADASHELRTPVAIMRTTAEVTRAKPRTREEHEKAWDVVLTQTERMSQLIGDLLMLARADSERHAPNREIMDAAAVLRECCSEMQIMADRSGLQLNRRIPHECSISGDPEDLRRIALILLDNAIKYTLQAGRITVELGVEGAPKSRMVIIRVQDSGIGIAECDLPHIFDRFYRAAKDRSRTTGGAGLGLPIARYLAERHHGFIQVESTLGTGSVFSLCLPVE